MNIIKTSLAIFVGVSAMVITSLLFTSQANASTIILRPNGDPGSSSWTPNTGSTRYGVLDNDPINSGEWICTAGGAGTVIEYYDLQDQSIGQGATSATVTANGATDYKLFDFNAPYHVLGIRVLGSNNTVNYRFPQSGTASTAGCAGSVGSWPWANYTTTSWSGSWTQSDVNAMQLIIGYYTPANNRSQALRQAYVTVTYDAVPGLSAEGATVFNNANSTTPGTRIANYNTTANLASKGAAFRLRMNLYNGGPDQWRAGFGSAKLQYVKKTVSDCSTATGWQDVQAGSGDIRWNDNPGVADNASISIISGDTFTASLYPQVYRESNNFTTSTNVPAGKYAQWDFSLKEAATVPGGTYCFKIVPVSGLTSILYDDNNDGAVVKTFGTLDVDIVDASGASVTNPTVNFGLMTTATSCTQSNATFGTTNQKVRVSNGSTTNGWSVSIAPAAGTTALWSTTGGKKYDFNDASGSPAGCADGGDTDTKAGQLTVKPNSGTITPISGCTNTGVSKGTNSAYSEGSVDSIALMTASSSSTMPCAWDLTGVGLTQTIPVTTEAGTYSLDLMITSVAL